MSKFLILAGFLWLSAAYWVEYGGDPLYLWMGLIPLIFVLCIQILRD
ncbi:MAG: hypothetical protein ACRBBJ_04780 [Rhodomicrobiaceae bacterium]